MKQLLFIIFTLLITLPNTSYAQGVNPYEKTTWNVIRERLFNGENSKAFKFEKDIRFQLVGAKTHQDSIIFTGMIAELNGLLETVQIKMVNTDPNFKLTMTKESGGWSSNYRWLNSGSEIVSVDIELGVPGAFNDKKSVAFIYYNTIRQFTKLYTPQHGSTFYGGVFDSSEFSKAKFKEIDKDLLKKLYSRDFYENLKENTVKKSGYQSYLYLRYQKLIRDLSYSLKAFLILFGFLFFFSKESKRKRNPSILLYIKQRIIILLILPFIFSFIEISSDFLFLLISRPVVFIVNFLVTDIYALLVLVFMYYTEPVFIKKINNFAGKQTFIFFSTIFAALIVLLIFIILFYLFSGFSLLSKFNFVPFCTQNSSQLFLIGFVAALRVFYNFVTYRIKSMVNKKDVEVSKMKELKN